MAKSRTNNIYFRCTEEEKKEIFGFKKQAGYSVTDSTAKAICYALKKNQQLESENKDLQLEIIRIKGEEKSNLRTEIMVEQLCKLVNVETETIKKLTLNELRKHKLKD